MASRHHRDSEHRRKIRESCNSCSSQKIRCGKQRPSCARCVTKGLECNYSYSQRTGRRAPSSAKSRSNSTTMATTAPPITPLTNEPDSLVDARSVSMSPLMPPLVMHGGDAFSFDSTHDTALTAFEDTENVFHDFSPSVPLDFLWSPTTETTTPYNTLVTSTGTTGAPQNIGPLSPYSQQNDKWQGLQNTDSATVPDAIVSSTSPEYTQEQRANPTRQTSQPYHHNQDCMALALQIVYDLHVSRERCKLAASDPLTCMQTSKDDLRDVDAVLFLNRDAIKSVNKILSCPCSADHSVAMACYLAAAKIVEWYGAAIGIAVDDTQDDNNNNNNRIPEDETQLRPISDRIISRPIFMGKYCLDAEVHRSVRAKVVLSELREHIQPLIGRLPKYHTSSSSFKGARYGSSLPSSFSKDSDGQTCALRNRVRKIIREANNINKHM